MAVISVALDENVNSRLQQRRRQQLIQPSKSTRFISDLFAVHLTHGFLFAVASSEEDSTKSLVHASLAEGSVAYLVSSELSWVG